MNYKQEALMEIYKALYEDNLVAAEEDYAEEFSACFDPAGIPESISKEGMMRWLVSLMSELLQSYCEKSDIAEVAINAGAGEDLLSELGLGADALD